MFQRYGQLINKENTDKQFTDSPQINLTTQSYGATNPDLAAKSEDSGLSLGRNIVDEFRGR